MCVYLERVLCLCQYLNDQAPSQHLLNKLNVNKLMKARHYNAGSSSHQYLYGLMTKMRFNRKVLRQ